MVQVGAGAAIASRPVAAEAGTSFVEWGAVVAGGALAAALSFVLLTFGAAIGLSFVSPWAGSGASPKLVASLAVFWTMAQQIGSAIVGGYVAGRMRSRWGEANEHEVEFRDGLHGGLVWAVGVMLGAALLVAAAGAIGRTGTEIAGQAATAAANSQPLAYSVDALLRSAPAPTRATTVPAATLAPGATVPPLAATAPAAPANAELRSETLRVLARSIANDELADEDRSYLAGVVAQRSGLSAHDAEKRVRDVFAQVNREAKATADKARRGALLTGFVTAASLLIALGAAWWAAQRGGHHRDNSIPARFTLPAPRRGAT